VDIFNGHKAGLFVNDSSFTPSANLYSFVISDTIYSPFPELRLNFPDNSGLALEWGAFTQGISLNIVFGIDGLSDFFDIVFRPDCRDAVSPTAGTPGLNGNLEIKGLHDSYYKNRESPHIAVKEITVSDAVNKLFSSEKKLMVEATKGKIESYVFDDPYRFTKEILLPQATNGKIRPYVFFRNLLDELHFESIELLEESAPVENLIFGEETEEDGAYNTLNSFLPYNESLKNTLANFHAEGKILKNDLSFEVSGRSVAAGAKDKIPVLTDTRIHHDCYFHRQFNPKVEYDQLNNAFFSDALRAGFFVDKAFATLPLHANLVAGKTVEVAVSILNEEGGIELSETFSGKWLIEQSYHSWNGPGNRSQTRLILCRSSMKPRRDSIIMDKAFKD
jgi:hypothetical protein